MYSKLYDYIIEAAEGEAPEAIKRPEGDEAPNRKYHYLVCDSNNIPLKAQLYSTLAEAKARQKREVEECEKLGIPAEAKDFPITDALKWLQFAK